MFIYPTYNDNWRNIITIYMYNKTSIKRNNLTMKQIHREVGRAKDLLAPVYGNDLPVLQPVAGSAAELLQDGYNTNHSAADHGGAKDKKGRETEDDRFAVRMSPVSVAGCHETTSAGARRTRSALCSPFYVGTSSPHRGSIKKQRKEIFSLCVTI